MNKNNLGDTLNLVLGLLIIGLALTIVGTAVYGVTLAFHASVILGVLSLFVQPAPLVFGLCGLFGTDLPAKIVEFFK